MTNCSEKIHVTGKSIYVLHSEPLARDVADAVHRLVARLKITQPVPSSGAGFFRLHTFVEEKVYGSSTLMKRYRKNQ